MDLGANENLLNEDAQSGHSPGSSNGVDGESAQPNSLQAGAQIRCSGFYVDHGSPQPYEGSQGKGTASLFRSV